VTVKINEIPEEGLTLSEPLDPAAIRLATPELKFTAELAVTANFQRQRETVIVEVGVRGEQEQICGRCLEPTAREFDHHFWMDYSARGRLDLDVTDDIRQEILLSYPVRFLCRESCRGLCPRCGANLNRESCHCKE
jgi:uncharacterized protein